MREAPAEKTPSLSKPALLGALTATVANVALYFVWSRAAGPLLVQNPETQALEPLHVGFVALVCVASALGAGVLAAALRRFAATRAGAVFLAVSAVVLALSFAPVVNVPMDGLTTQVGLSLMHLIAAVSIALPLLKPLRAAPAGSAA